MRARTPLHQHQHQRPHKIQMFQLICTRHFASFTWLIITTLFVCLCLTCERAHTRRIISIFKAKHFDYLLFYVIGTRICTDQLLSNQIIWFHLINNNKTTSSVAYHIDMDILIVGYRDKHILTLHDTHSTAINLSHECAFVPRLKFNNPPIHFDPHHRSLPIESTAHIVSPIKNDFKLIFFPKTTNKKVNKQWSKKNRRFFLTFMIDTTRNQILRGHTHFSY